MVLKFEEYINEGLWSSGMKRAENNEKREEDASDLKVYFKNIEWVDLGHPDILFAKSDFPDEPQDQEDLLSTNDIDEFIKELPDDVNILSYRELKWLCTKTSISLHNPKHTPRCKTLLFTTTKGTVYMNASVYYFLRNVKLNEKPTTEPGSDVYIFPSPTTVIGTYRHKLTKNSFFDDNTERNKKCYCLKLVKLKHK